MEISALNVQYVVSTVPLRVVMSDYEHYLSLPACQRDYAWETKLVMKQRLIDTILRGWPMTPIFVQRGPVTLMGRPSYILDGQQRLRTIRSFYLCEFRCAKRGFRDEPKLVVLERDRTFSELSEIGRMAFLDYDLPIVSVSGAESIDSGSIYRRLNCQEPLTWAEKLYSYSTSSPDFEKEIELSPVWRMFSRTSDRKQRFQMAVMCCMIEASESGIKNTTLPTAAAEISEHVVNSALIQTVSNNLETLERMYRGLTFSAMGEIIPLYQSINFLNRNRVNFLRSDPGCLMQWYVALREISLARERRRRTANGPVSVFEMADVPAQISFWAEHLADLLNMDGLVFKDSRRSFSMIDKLRMLDKQKGKCAQCNKIITMTSEADHIIPHANGGPTEVTNGQILCLSCHRKKTEIAISTR